MNVPPDEIDEWAQIPLDVLPNDLRFSVWYRPQMDPDYSCTISLPVVPRATTYNEYILLLPEWEQQFLSEIHWYNKLDDCIELLKDSIIFGTDGSAKRNIGAFSWILSTKKGQRIAHNTGDSPSKD